MTTAVVLICDMCGTNSLQWVGSSVRDAERELRTGYGWQRRQQCDGSGSRVVVHLCGGCSAYVADLDTRTRCTHGHVFTKSNTYVAPSGRKQCRQCWRNADARRREKEKQWQE